MLAEGLPESRGDVEGDTVPEEQGVAAGLLERVADSVGAAPVREGDSRPDAVKEGEAVVEGDARGDAEKDTLAVGVRDDVVDGERVLVPTTVAVSARDRVVVVVDEVDALAAAEADCVPVAASLGEPGRTVTVCVPVRASLGDTPKLRLTVPVGRGEGDAAVALGLPEGGALALAAEGDALSLDHALGDSPSEGVEEALPRGEGEVRQLAEEEGDLAPEGDCGEADTVPVAACDGDAATEGLGVLDALPEAEIQDAEAEAEAAAEALAPVFVGVREEYDTVASGEAETRGV